MSRFSDGALNVATCLSCGFRPAANEHTTPLSSFNARSKRARETLYPFKFCIRLAPVVAGNMTKPTGALLASPVRTKFCQLQKTTRAKLL
eukprot:1071961-Amphidinium_carterae.1